MSFNVGRKIKFYTHFYYACRPMKSKLFPLFFFIIQY